MVDDEEKRIDEYWDHVNKKRDREDNQRKTLHEIASLEHIVDQKLVGKLGEIDFWAIPESEIKKLEEGLTPQELNNAIKQQLNISIQLVQECPSLPSYLNRRWTNTLKTLDVNLPNVTQEIHRLQEDISDYYDTTQYDTASGDVEALHLAGGLADLMNNMKYLEKLCVRYLSSFVAG